MRSTDGSDTCLLTIDQAAALYGTTAARILMRHVRGEGPGRVILGGAVFYDPACLAAWAASWKPSPNARPTRQRLHVAA